MELYFSRTKILVELKIAAELKFGGDPWVMGTLRPSAKRSAELKHNINCSGTKIPMELKWGGPLGDEDPKCKCKEVSRTKMQLKFAVELTF